MSSETQLRDFGRLICSIANRNFMSRQETCEAYRQIILNLQPELQQGAFLMAHITRGPSIEELSGAWDALDRYDTEKINPMLTGPVSDIVGTGSDSLKTVNCSTPAALIASACGLPIAKKGARLVTGVSGASDVLEILGIDLNASLSQAEKCLDKHGICYLPGEAFLKSGWARLIRSMRFTSAFNIIGPLTMPCSKTNSIVIGAYSASVCDQLVAILKEIGFLSALAPFGMAEGYDSCLGMDEFSIAGPTSVVQLKKGKIDTYEVAPSDFGLKTLNFSAIASSQSAQGNARRILEVLSGRYDTPDADFFCMNASAALYISGVAPNFVVGTDMAKEALANGKALEKLENLRHYQGSTL
jgi:anthranilate phosphoribosyltransferase